jgi:hypothetical protein
MPAQPWHDCIMAPGDHDPLSEGDASLNDEPTAAEDGSPQGFERWRRESALGNVGTGVARGLQAVFAPPQDQPVIVASVPGDPPNPDGLKVVLDPDDPSKSVVILPSAEDDAADPPVRP